MSIHRLIHREVLHLRIPTATVRRFIKTPARIGDYYPGARDWGVIQDERVFYCGGSAGISLFEVLEDEPHRVRLRVWTARGLSSPPDTDALKEAAFFVMDEDWELTEVEGGTTLTKSWHRLEKRRLRFLPMAFIIRRAIPRESEKMVAKWEAHAAG